MTDGVTDLQTEDIDVADPDVDEGTDPDTDGEEPEDEGTAASDEGEDGDEPAADDADDSDDDEPATTKGRSAKLDKLLSKYNGDPDKMVDAYFEQANSMSRLFQKLSDLEEKLVAKAADPEEEAKFVANDSEVKEFGAELSQIDGQIKQTQQTQTAMVGEFGRLDKLIAKLEGKYESASIEDKADIKEELNEAKSDMKSLTRDWKDSQRELATLEKQIKMSARQYRAAEAAAKTRREAEKQREVDSVHAQRVTQAEFLGTVKAEAAKYGIEPGNKTYNVVQQAVRDRIVSFLRGLPANSKPINIPETVAKLMAEYAEALELKGRFKQKSKLKIQAQGKSGPTGKPEGTKSNNLSPKSAAYWKDRAKRLAG